MVAMVLKNHKLLLTGILILIYVLTMPTGGLTKIPEPDNIIYGYVGEGVNTVTLRVNDELIASYNIGSNPNAEGFYILRVPIDALNPIQTGTAQIGDEGLIYIDGIPAEIDPIIIGDRGTIKRIDLAEGKDSDNDGIPNDVELGYGLDPNNPDTDGDGINDGDELDWNMDTDSDGLINALDPDSDNDGMPDGWEVDNGLNPLIDDSQDDTDGDGITNRKEYDNGTDPTNPFSRLALRISASGMAILPSIGVDNNDNSHIVWEDREDGSNYEIYYKGFDGSQWSDIINVSETLGNSFRPTITIDDIGNIHIVWEDTTSGNYEIYYRRYNGLLWSNIENISRTTGDSLAPEIAIDNMGNIHLVWEELSTGSYEIYYSMYDGISWSEGINISETAGYSYSPAIAIDTNRDIHIVWMEEVSSGVSEIYYRRYDGLSWLTSEDISNNQGRSLYPDILVDSIGNIHVAWEDIAPGNYEIYYREYDNNKWLPTVNISNTEGYSGSARLSIDSSDHLQVVWKDDISGLWEVYYTEFDGASWQLSQNISNTSGDSSFPGIAGDTSGHIHVVWEENDGNITDIFYNIYNQGIDEPVDIIPPASVTDLAIGVVTDASIQLTWTAPGDDWDTGIDTSTSYDIRYSQSSITETNWVLTTQVTGEPLPQIAGSSESFTVIGLTCGTTYYFALKTSDEVLNTSGLSNVSAVTTAPCPDNIVFIRERISGSQGLQIYYDPPATIGGDIGSSIASDNRIGKNVILITAGEFDGDDGREIVLVRQNPKTGVQRLQIHDLPTTVGGDIGSPIASDNRIGDADTDSNTILLTGGDFDGDGIDKIALVREDLNGRQMLAIYNVPSTVGGDIGLPIASDRKIGNSAKNSNVVLMTAVDYDSDGSPEFAFVRQRLNGRQRLMIYEPPAMVGGDIGSPIASDIFIGNAITGNNVSQIAGGDFDGDGEDEIAMVRKKSNGIQRLLIYDLPTNVGGEIGLPIASDRKIGNSAKNSNVILISGVSY